jgi:hypothetical protein
MSFSALLLTAVLVPVAALGGAVVSATADHGETLRLLDTGATIDVFLAGGDPSHTGDREVFRDTLVWAKDHRPAGKAEGHCTVIEASTATTTCTIVTTLQQGTLTTEGVGVFLPRRNETFPRSGSSGRWGEPSTALRHIVISTHVMGSPARRLTNPITRCWNHPITAMQGQTTCRGTDQRLAPKRLTLMCGRCLSRTP